MKLVRSTDLASKLTNSHLILDTNVFLHAVDNEDFFDLLLKIRSSGCTLMTIPSVIFEFARGAKSVEEYNWYVDFVNSLGVVVYKNVEESIAKDKAFSVLLQTECKKYGGKASYTDFLLMMLLHKFDHSGDIYLMTANYKDIPLKLFEREDLIAIEYQNGVQSQALYKNSPAQLAEIAKPFSDK